ncbi:putative F-box protein PP2-B12 [Phragmites australis]|uniref:putative F-box protein PP2-B12 n=1 Tax=Phragmites australis TaxID=29695 RepID=UPI002D78EDF0|nr:putative F-box protein PP2-B12 [Phragmites australis]
MPAGGAPLRGDLLRRAASHDAFRATAVSLPFRAADAVWACFQPPGLPPLSDWELSPGPLSKGALFKLLSERPFLLADGFTVRKSSSFSPFYSAVMWLDRETGTKFYMLSARALCIVLGDTLQYWSWIPHTDSRSRTEIMAAITAWQGDLFEAHSYQKWGGNISILMDVWFGHFATREAKIPRKLDHHTNNVLMRLFCVWIW